MSTRTDKLIHGLQLQVQIQQEEMHHLTTRIKQQAKSLAILREQLDLIKARYGQPTLRPTLPSTPPPIQDPATTPLYGQPPIRVPSPILSDLDSAIEGTSPSDLTPELGQ